MTGFRLKCSAELQWVKDATAAMNLIYETLGTGEGNGLLISILEKLNRIWFDRSKNIRTINMKMDGIVLEEKSPFKNWECLSLLNQIEALTFSLLLKLFSRNWSLDSSYKVSFS